MKIMFSTKIGYIITMRKNDSTRIEYDVTKCEMNVYLKICEKECF